MVLLITGRLLYTPFVAPVDSFIVRVEEFADGTQSLIVLLTKQSGGGALSGTSPFPVQVRWHLLQETGISKCANIR